MKPLFEKGLKISITLLCLLLVSCNSFNENIRSTTIITISESSENWDIKNGYSIDRPQTNSEEEKRKERTKVQYREIVLCNPNNIFSLHALPPLPINSLGSQSELSQIEQEDIILKHIEELRSLVRKYQKMSDSLHNGQHMACSKYRILETR